MHGHDGRQPQPTQLLRSRACRVANALWACRQDRHRRLIALGEQCRQPVEQRDPARAGTATAGAALAARATSSALEPRRRQGVRRTSLRTAPRDRSRVRGRGRALELARRRRAAARRRRSRAWRRTRSERAAGRHGPVGAGPSERRLRRREAASSAASRRAGLELRSCGGERSVRPARGVGRVSATARSRNAAAAANPPRACARAAERSSSAATSSSGADAACGTVPRAAIRVDALDPSPPRARGGPPVAP